MTIFVKNDKSKKTGSTKLDEQKLNSQPSVSNEHEQVGQEPSNYTTHTNRPIIIRYNILYPIKTLPNRASSAICHPMESKCYNDDTNKSI